MTNHMADAIRAIEDQGRQQADAFIARMTGERGMSHEQTLNALQEFVVIKAATLNVGGTSNIGSVEDPAALAGFARRVEAYRYEAPSS